MAKMKLAGRILVLAEHTTKRQGAQVLLENRGFQITCTASTADAAMIVREWRPDLMVVEEGLALPSNAPPSVSLGRTALGMLGAVEEAIKSRESRPSAARVPNMPGSWAPPVDHRIEEQQLRETVLLADEAVRRALIASFALRGTQFKIITVRADYTFAPAVATCFLRQLLAESTRSDHAH